MSLCARVHVFLGVVGASLATVDGKQRSLKETVSVVMHIVTLLAVAISIQLLYLPLCIEPQTFSSHALKKPFILLLKLQYIDEVINILSLLSPKISEG